MFVVFVCRWRLQNISKDNIFVCTWYKNFLKILKCLKEMANHYEVPGWAGKPPVGLHLDVLKGDKLIQKLMIDEKKCYLFGRNAQMNDFCIDHASCSRVHAAFVYHKNLERAFLVDLGSTHGTFIGTMRLEPNKPTQLPIDSTFHFGASTRHYVIRERPQAGSRPIIDELERSGMGEDVDGGLLGLPETEIELDNLTEFNTAHNRRISMLGITDATDTEKNTSGGSSNRKRSRRGVSFNEDEEVINPEDVDPSVGRFRNLVHSTVVPSAQKRARLGSTGSDLLSGNLMAGRHQQPQTAPLASGPSAVPHLYHGLPPEAGAGLSAGVGAMYSSLSARLGLVLPNPAPDVEMGEPSMPGSGGPFAAALPHGSSATASAQAAAAADALEPRKKKYAKEAWPGKKPAPALF